MSARQAGDGKRAPARLVVLDGIDGCGKSTQAELLVRALREAGRGEPVHVREPGSTSAGERIRELVLDPDVRLGAESQVLLFAAARRQMLDELVLPALAAGRDVVCERFHPSTFAYQAVAGGLDEERVLSLLQEWCAAPPDTLTLILDVSPARAGQRRGAGHDRFEGRGLAFQEAVARGYRRYAERVPEARVLEGDAPRQDVAARVRAEVLG